MAIRDPLDPPIHLPLVAADGKVDENWRRFFSRTADAVSLLIAAGATGTAPGLFADLPTPATAGMLRVVTNSNTATWGAVIAGGGANTVLAFYNGTAWTVCGK